MRHSAIWIVARTDANDSPVLSWHHHRFRDFASLAGFSPIHTLQFYWSSHIYILIESSLIFRGFDTHRWWLIHSPFATKLIYSVQRCQVRFCWFPYVLLFYFYALLKFRICMPQELIPWLYILQARLKVSIVLFTNDRKNYADLSW